MKLSAITDRIDALFLPAAPLLVCETDGFNLYAAMVARDGKNGLKVLYSVESQAREAGDAVAEVLAKLRAHGWVGGGKAILLSPGVLPGMPELPVNPAKPRPPAQMQELVRWEVENLLIEYTALWSVGRLLVGSGYLDESQAREIIARQQQQRRTSSAALDMNNAPQHSLKQFGDLAVEYGYITQAQLEDCLKRQEWFRVDGEEIACGWSPQVDKRDKAVRETWPWLACGVSRKLLDHWVEAFALGGVKLDALYPLVGCATAALPLTEEPALVIEVHAGLLVGMRVENGRLKTLHLHQSALPGRDLDACLEVYHLLVPPDIKSLWLAGSSKDLPEMAESLSAIIGWQVGLLNMEAGHGMRFSPGMAGAARHALALKGGALCCEVPVGGPRVPIWKQPEFRLVAAGVILLVLLAAAEISLQVRHGLVVAEKEKVDQQVAETDKAFARIKALQDKVNEAKKKVTAVQDEMAKVDARMNFFGATLDERASLVLALLDELKRGVTDDVVVDRIEENPKTGFRISAWAMTEPGALRFVQSMETAMAEWDMDVRNVSTTAAQGRYSLPGFAIRFDVVAAPPIEATPAEIAAAAPTPAVGTAPASGVTPVPAAPPAVTPNNKGGK